MERKGDVTILLLWTRPLSGYRGFRPRVWKGAGGNPSLQVGVDLLGFYPISRSDGKGEPGSRFKRGIYAIGETREENLRCQLSFCKRLGGVSSPFLLFSCSIYI
jgi:hypothetical protein